MEYRRRRSSERKTQSTGGGGKVIAVLILIVAGVYFISISAAGNWLSKNIVEPVFSVFMANDKDGAEESDGASMFTVNTNGDVSLPKIECYLLQMGVFSSRDNAEALAASLISKGGAGYVMQDGEKYRVFASGYAKESEAKSVKENLKNEGYDCSIHEITTQTTDFGISVMSGTDSTITDLQDMFYALLSAHDDILELETGFDQDSMSIEQGQSAVTEVFERFKESTKGKEMLPSEITDCISAFETEFEKLTASDAKSVSATEYSAMLKYAQIAMACEFMNMVNSLVE